MKTAHTAPPSDDQPDESTDIPPLALFAVAFAEKEKWEKRGSPPLEISLDGGDLRPIRAVVDEIFETLETAEDLAEIRKTVRLLLHIDRVAVPRLAEIKKT